MNTNQQQTRTRLAGMIAAETTRPMAMRITMHGAKYLIDNKLGNQPDWIAENRCVKIAVNQALKVYFAHRVELSTEETAPQAVIDAIAEIDAMIALRSRIQSQLTGATGVTFMGVTYHTEYDAADAVAYDYITGAGTWDADQVSQIIRGSDDGLEVQNGSTTTSAIFAAEALSDWTIHDLSTEALTLAMQRFIDTRPDMEAGA